jgi:hypothetical protein
VIVAGFFQAEALHDLPDVGFEGLGTEVEPGGNGGVRTSLRHQGQNLELPRCESVERAVFAGPAQEAVDDRRVDHTLAGSDPVESVDEDVDMDKSVGVCARRGFADEPPRADRVQQPSASGTGLAVAPREGICST